MRRQIGLLVATLAVVPHALHASTINVTTTTDEVAANGVCSLREAILVAASDVPTYGCSPSGPTGPTDLVVVPPGLYALTLPSGALSVQGTIEIRGATERATVVRQDVASKGVMIGASGVDMTLSHLTLEHGDSPAGGGAIQGAGSGTLTLSDVVLDTNRCAGIGGGGAVSWIGSLIMIRTHVIGNWFAGGGVGGGGVLAYRATISDSLFEHNGVALSDGGALLLFGGGGGSTITNTVFRQNTAGKGGAIFLNGPGPFDIRDCTFERNIATGGGGAIDGGFAPIYVRNSTFVGNLSQGAAGGAVNVVGGASAVLEAVTIVDNESVNGIGGVAGPSNTVLHSAIVFANTPLDVGGGVTSAGFNVFGAPTGMTLQPSDQLVADAGLLSYDPLAIPPVVAPSGQSPALDKGDCVLVGGTNLFDQRGASRPFGGGCDAGAVEYHHSGGLKTTAMGVSGGVCAADGWLISTGEDVNDDGMLGAGEIVPAAALTVCNAVPAVVTCPSGPSCPSAPSGTTDMSCMVPAVVTCPICPSAPSGTTDMSGISGAPSTALSTLIATAIEPAGENCPNGGTRITAGNDQNGNGALDVEEVGATSFTCVMKAQSRPAGCNSTTSASLSVLGAMAILACRRGRRRPAVG